MIRFKIGLKRCIWVIFLISSFTVYGSEAFDKAASAYESYVQGERATSVAERQDSFNRALALYTELAEEAAPSGQLYYNIANCYYQLGEYPWAILYYYRAEKLCPRDYKIQQNLRLALHKLGLDDKKSRSIFQKILFLHYGLSVPERLAVFFVLSVLAIITASIYFWFRQRAVKIFTTFVMVCMCVCFLSLMISHYFSGVHAVLVHSSPLLRDAGHHYAPVLETPLLSGIKVEVLEVTQQGQWLKITTLDGTMGYVPYDAIRFI